MPLVLGYMGLLNGLIFSPILVGQAATGLLTGLTPTILGWVIMKGLFDNVLSDYFW
eukprot:SAG31_NODE_13126_length_891_cov_1.099747_2_plen_55_part_01